jgi:hypothetical protein
MYVVASHPLGAPGPQLGLRLGLSVTGRAKLALLEAGTGPSSAKPTSHLVPNAQVPVEAVPRFLGQISEHRCDADFYRLALVVDVLAAEEVMLIDDGPSRQPLRTEK